MAVDRAKTFGPDSLIWQNFGSRLAYLHGAAYGIMQNMYPALGAGVSEHSDVYDDPWSRLTRSLPQDERGVRPVEGVRIEEKERLYQESIDWYTLYGLSMRPVPPDYDAFEAYWERTCAEVLEPTPAAMKLLRLFDNFGENPYPGVPRVLWRLTAPLIARPLLWLNTGVLPPTVREKLGLNWSDADERGFRRVMWVLDQTWSRLPPRIGMIARAYEAHRRALNLAG